MYAPHRKVVLRGRCTDGQCDDFERELGDDSAASVRGGPILFELLSTSNASVSVTPGEERLRSAGETGFRFRIRTPFSHLVLRQAVGATVSPNQKSHGILAGGSVLRRSRKVIGFRGPGRRLSRNSLQEAVRTA